MSTFSATNRPALERWQSVSFYFTVRKQLWIQRESKLEHLLRLKITLSEKLYSFCFIVTPERASIKRCLLVLLKTFPPTEAFEKTIVDICWDICLSLWTMAVVHLYFWYAVTHAHQPSTKPKKKTGVKTSIWLPASGQVIINNPSYISWHHVSKVDLTRCQKKESQDGHATKDSASPNKMTAIISFTVPWAHTDRQDIRVLWFLLKMTMQHYSNVPYQQKFLLFPRKIFFAGTYQEVSPRGVRKEQMSLCLFAWILDQFFILNLHCNKRLLHK